MNWSKETQAILDSESFESRAAALADGQSATDRERTDARTECARVLADADAQQ